MPASQNTLKKGAVTRSSRPSLLTGAVALPVVSAVLYALCFPNFNLYLFSWVFLIPVLAVCRGMNYSPGVARAGGFVFGLLFFLCVIYSFAHNSYFIYMIASIYFSLYLFLFIFIIERFLRKGRSIIFWAPALWVALEYIRGEIIFTCPIFNTSAAQVHCKSLIQIASVTGAWGVSFVVILINVLIYENLFLGVIKKEGVKSKVSTITALMIVFIVFAYGIFELKHSKDNIGGQPFKIAVIQPDIKQDMKKPRIYNDHVMDRLTGLTLQAEKEHPGLVIWPENSVQGELRYDKEMYRRVTALVNKLDIPILLGSLDSLPGETRKFYMTAFLVYPLRKVPAVYNKIRLFPFVEYIPLLDYVPYIKELFDIWTFSPGSEYYVFEVPQIIKERKSGEGGRRTETRMVKFGTLICFEDLFSDLSRRLAVKDIDFLVNITNDACFKESNRQMSHAYCSLLRAVENRTFLVRAANSGYSCVIDPYGYIVKDLRDKNGNTLYVPGYFTYELRPIHKNTLYEKYGDYFPVACCIISLIGLLAISGILSKNRKSRV
ncbi:apolipoprotein N-acyltransferase [Candidatus Auribacterota bacterium]